MNGRRDRNILEAILDELQENNRKLSRIEQQNKEILAIVSEEPPLVAQSATLTFRNAQGEQTMASAHVNDKPGSYKYQEFYGPNGTGNPVPPTGVVVYASDNPAVATIDPASGQLTYVGAGSTNISASDGGSLPATDVLTLSAAAAVSSTLTFTPGA